MSVFTPREATKRSSRCFTIVTTSTFSQASHRRLPHQRPFTKFNFADDCPVFDGMYDFCKAYAGGSLAGARRLAAAKRILCYQLVRWIASRQKFEASGFCYINDIVLGIMSSYGSSTCSLHRH